MSVSGFHDSANKPLQLLALVPIQYIKMTIQTPIAMRELHSRVSDGIHVRLLWGEGDGQLSVSVTDTRTGSAFCLEIREGEKAMDVFHHPFAYAHFHGVETGARLRPGDPEPTDSDVSLAA
jgi:hypothetical protein